jgi:hypothetical protein
MLAFDMTSLQVPAPSGTDPVSRLFCWPSSDKTVVPRPRADAAPGRPPRLPRRGRQNLVNPGGYERWVSSDEDFVEGAWGVTPARFLFARALPQLVELPALWTSIPARIADFSSLVSAIDEIVEAHDLPAPHLMTRGNGSVAILWHLSPLHMPAALKADATPAERARHDAGTKAFRRCVVDWKRAAIKLRLAFAELGALPHTVATVDEQLVEHIPFPLRPDAAVGAIEDLHDDAPSLLRSNDGPLLKIADISRPLGMYDKAMWATLKVGRPRRARGTRWLESDATQQALTVTEPGARHKAAVTIACAARWDGLSQEDSVALLRSWASKCKNDGRFPWRRKSGDELEHLVLWSQKALRPGGPTPRNDAQAAGRIAAPLEAAAAAIVTLLGAADGVFTTTLDELRREAGLLMGYRIAPRTLQRALAALKASGLITHDIERVGRTWRSHFAVLDTAGESRSSHGQKGESLWDPDRQAHTLRGGEGDASPAGRGVRGEGKQLPAPEPRTPETASDPEPQAPQPELPENDLVKSSRSRVRRRRQPVPLPLPFSADGVAKPSRRRRRHRVPVVTQTVLDAVEERLIDSVTERHLRDAGLPTSLTPDELSELVDEARRAMTLRPRVLADLVGVLTRASQRLLRLRAFAALAAKTAAARRSQRPQAVSATQPSKKEQQTGLALLHAAQAAADARIAARLQPLHLQPALERARTLHAHDLSLVPLKPRSKAPPENSTWRNAQLRLASLDDLDHTIAAIGPDAGLAVVCGPVSGIVVVDLDDQTAVDWAVLHLPETPWRTKTSRGEHWYYRLADGWEAPATLPYVGQLQASGRYVVAPGSLHPDGATAYLALGDWTRPKTSLPVLRNEWFEDAAVRRARRQNILRPTP